MKEHGIMGVQIADIMIQNKVMYSSFVYYITRK